MSQPKPEIIDTTSQVSALVDWLQTHHTPPNPYLPIMFLDLEGISLSHSGSLSILTILLHPHARICLVDVHKLGSLAFSTAGSGGQTLKDILQDSQITKVFFDVRNDSDTLFAHFRVALQGVEDLQLMESATRETTSSCIYVASLAKCMQTDCSSIATWQAVKEKRRAPV
jgi:exonuclease 3'-5' domain-containing protein 1